MRLILFLFLTSCCLVVTGQKLDYRNDSLFVNNYFIDAKTGKATLDSLLMSKSKIKTSKSSFRIHPTTGKKVVETTMFYYDLGLFFRKYDYDTTKFSIGIKLYHDTDLKEDKQDELTQIFMGQLYIADNYINDKRTIKQLEQLNNCHVTVTKASLGSYSTIIGGDIFYKKNIIRLTFDKRTSELTSVFIHHNFQDR